MFFLQAARGDEQRGEENTFTVYFLEVFSKTFRARKAALCLRFGIQDQIENDTMKVSVDGCEQETFMVLFNRF